MWCFLSPSGALEGTSGRHWSVYQDFSVCLTLYIFKVVIWNMLTHAVRVRWSTCRSVVMCGISKHFTMLYAVNVHDLQQQLVKSFLLCMKNDFCSMYSFIFQMLATHLCKSACKFAAMIQKNLWIVRYCKRDKLMLVQSNTITNVEQKSVHDF